MRKDMIPGLGDTADLVVIGARRDTDCGMSAWWTTFYLACVDTKAESEDGQSLPSFTIIATVSRMAITTADMRYLNRYGKAHYLSPADASLTPRIWTPLAGHPPPSAIFMRPLVVEVVGASFDRLPNSRFESLRFPRIVKVHLDLSYTDATITEQYVQMAAKSKC
ncbi:uncharacterized protein HMPREF1541_10920 [Cyphellophora europaea CBS 101466]|uniref:Uncharacterized protein n=1 Tax=Cyphellophora europaea (strain CBS 101466) TaxID=1220924 RepID=W2S611_CYPE1|nr:uncharacterized protein HMPREF1541_10920 [Cyphellophora europaea CBS 101466]ETN44055.1 hypothetical protein HMPREF1541_10920 [Cyphellophora europaea CBS 101466]